MEEKKIRVIYITGSPDHNFLEEREIPESEARELIYKGEALKSLRQKDADKCVIKL